MTNEMKLSLQSGGLWVGLSLCYTERGIPPQKSGDSAQLGDNEGIELSVPSRGCGLGSGKHDSGADPRPASSPPGVRKALLPQTSVPPLFKEEDRVQLPS